MRNKRGKTYLPAIIISVACASVAVALVAIMVRGSRGRDASAVSDVGPAAAPVKPVHKIAFADPPRIPAAEPASDRALVARTQALAEAKPEQAAAALKEIVKGTRDPAALTVAATVAQKLSPDDASAIHSEIVAKGNASPYAYRGLAEAHVKKGQAKEACAAYEEGLKRNPTEFALREAYARYLAGLGRTQDAADVCLNDIEGRPLLAPSGVEGWSPGDGVVKDTRSNSMRRCILAGEILFAAGDKAKARAAWEKIPEIAETEQEGQRYVAQLLALHNMSR